MRKMKSLVLAVMGLLCSMSVSAHNFEVNGIYYNITSQADNTVAVTYRGDYSGSYSDEYSGEVKIPESVTYSGNTYSVTSIGNRAFDECISLTSVEIPNSVTSIGYSAFYGTAWYNNQPDGVIYAGKVLYKYKGTMTANTSITIEDGTVSISPYAFQNCLSLTSVEIPNSVTSIGGSAFSSCRGLTSVEIGNRVTSIGDAAFGGCSSLTSVEIPNSVTSIGDAAFVYCSSLTSMVVAPNNPKYDSRDNCNAIIESESNTLIAGCQNSTIPNSVTSIGGSAFYRCYSLTSVEIPNSVTSIGSSAFEYCKNLKKLISYAEVPPVCGWGVFNGVNTQECTLQVPEKSISAYQQADQWKEFFPIEGVPTAIGGATVDGAVPATADVYSTNGMLVKRNADLKNLKHELPAGIYIIGGKKVYVR